MKKKHAKRLRDIAKQMGDIRYTSYEWIPISGEDLLLSNMKQINGKKIFRNQTYEVQIPVIHIHSAEKELKRSFIKKGENGVYSVVKTKHDKLFHKKN